MSRNLDAGERNAGAGLSADAETATLWGIPVAVFCLSLGLLIGALAFPLRWLPGQLPLLIVMLWLVPLTAMLVTRHASGLTGLAASDYTQRARLAQYAALALALIVLPTIEWRQSGHASSWLGPDYAAAVAVSVALCTFARAAACNLVNRWYTLQPQQWETVKQSNWSGAWDETPSGARVDRSQVIRDLWRDWGIGGVALALAMLVSENVATNGIHAAVPWGVLAFAGYSCLGPLLIGQAARIRWTVQWRLEQLPVSPTVSADWSKAVGALTLVALLCAVLLPALRLLDLAHLAVRLLWDNVLVPLLNALSMWLSRLMGTNLPRIPTTAPHHVTPPITRQPPPPSPRHGTSSSLAWLGHAWPLLLGALALAILLWLAIQSRKRRAGQPGRWRAVLAAVLAELRAVLVLLWRPARKLVSQTVEDVRRGAGRRIRRTPRGPRPGDLPPRQAIVALYLTMLEQAARRGFPRRTGQTPREYAAEVGEQVPAGQEPLAGMTDLFVAVRYGAQPADSPQVTRMQALISALRTALRAASRRK